MIAEPSHDFDDESAGAVFLAADFAGAAFFAADFAGAAFLAADFTGAADFAGAAFFAGAASAVGAAFTGAFFAGMVPFFSGALAAELVSVVAGAFFAAGTFFAAGAFVADAGTFFAGTFLAGVFFAAAGTFFAATFFADADDVDPDAFSSAEGVAVEAPSSPRSPRTVSAALRAADDATRLADSAAEAACDGTIDSDCTTRERTLRTPATTSLSSSVGAKVGTILRLDPSLPRSNTPRPRTATFSPAASDFVMPSTTASSACWATSRLPSKRSAIRSISFFLLTVAPQPDVTTPEVRPS